MDTLALPLVNRFTKWHNKNLRGETIFNTDRSTLDRRLKQFSHLNRLTPAQDLALRLKVSVLVAQQSRANLTVVR